MRSPTRRSAQGCLLRPRNTVTSGMNAVQHAFAPPFDPFGSDFGIGQRHRRFVVEHRTWVAEPIDRAIMDAECFVGERNNPDDTKHELG